MHSNRLQFIFLLKNFKKRIKMKIIFLTMMLFSVSFIWVFGKDSKLIVPESTSPIEIGIGDVILNLQFEVPQISPNAPDIKHWKHSNRNIVYHRLAGISGFVTQDVFLAKGLKLEREGMAYPTTWQSGGSLQDHESFRSDNQSGSAYSSKHKGGGKFPARRK